MIIYSIESFRFYLLPSVTRSNLCGLFKRRRSEGKLANETEYSLSNLCDGSEGNLTNYRSGVRLR